MSCPMVLKYPGSKGSMRDKIISLMPEHKRYCEPFGGSAAVLLAKPVATVEYYNDLNEDVVNLFRIIRAGGKSLRRLCRLVEATPFARAELSDARDEQQVDRSDCALAYRFLVRSWFSINGSISNEKTGWRISTKDSKRLGTWNRLPERLLQAAIRLKSVHIEQVDAVKLMLMFDGVDALFYVDPPYIESTINFREKQVYSTSFSLNAHEDLLCCLDNLKGRVILSGYEHDLYTKRLSGRWHRIDVAHWTQRHTVKTECLWLNYQQGAPS
ncbi:MAG: DNA adenine methylase [Burkholderiaceae bacterium]